MPVLHLEDGRLVWAGAGMSERRPAPSDAGERPGPLLPRRDGRDGALMFVIAVLCALACLAVLAGAAADRAAQGWRGDLEASATVQVRPKPGETSAEAAARGAEALAGVKGVSEARALDRAAAVKLLEPWLGKGAVPEDLPIPELVTVDLDPKAPADAAALNAALTPGRRGRHGGRPRPLAGRCGARGADRAAGGWRGGPGPGAGGGRGDRLRHPRGAAGAPRRWWRCCTFPARRTASSPACSRAASRWLAAIAGLQGLGRGRR